ncbi:hypothetical protein [Pyxidicoccus xibeiensis]|uniref:hypothetical protein n=1 Tax=Pyxidicoccus xibeiensis TaxID=2906759 RepID=UPI0020A79DDE|nr:hypothetical protein [Pyxidicoccus xibeiensis]MCP3138325.1 hypothetical protein [Pyxidicoccus xibeiensis]
MAARRPVQGLVLTLALASTASAHAAAPGPEVGAATRAFKELERTCRADAGALWGGSLCAPVLVVDDQSRRFIASEAPKQGRYPGPPFTGELPPQVTVANTAMEWAGTLWVQLLWPLPEDPTALRVMLAHEAFHHFQRRQGLTTGDRANAHLDSARGRTLLQLEWRALARALESRGATRRAAVQDALGFRTARRALFPKATEEERALEQNEGLAEYTGVRLGAPTAAARLALAKTALAETPKQPTLVRSLGQASGPAYGLLLDDAAGARWRREALARADLGELLARALSLDTKPPSEELLASRGKAYGAPELEQREAERERVAQARLVTLRKRFVEGPVLRLPFERMNIQFKPGELVPIEGAGTVYPSGRIVDAWGSLTVRAGVLVDEPWKSATVPLPLETHGNKLSGDGWELELAPGWEQAPGARTGDVTVRKTPG